MTEKLYDRDSHLSVFSARVLSCEQTKGGWAVVLDRTAFFPESGGQSADTGLLGSVRVLDAHERGEDVVHLCAGPLPIGETVEGRLDFEARWRKMQNHTGEHIFSGLVHSLYGFENIGFHLTDAMAVDFSGELSREQLRELERMANEVVRRNLPVTAWYPAPDELAALRYRSKKELHDPVRLVQIGDVDLCACCAPHVSFTGEVGLIKLLDAQRHRGGVRLSMVCGMDAFETLDAYQQSVTEISQALSAPRQAVGDAVRRVQQEQEALKARCAELAMAYITRLAAAVQPAEGNLVLFDSLLDEVAQRELVNLLSQKAGGFAAVFCGSDAEGYRYCIGSRSADLRKAARAINEAIGGRGGGRPEMISGRALASRKEIESRLVLMNI